MAPFYGWLNCLKATATSRRQFAFYHSVPRNSWYSFYRPRKDERLSRPWRSRHIFLTSCDYQLCSSVSVLSLLLLISLWLSLYLHYLFVLPFFNVIIVISVLPIIIIKIEPCTTCTLNDLAHCSIGIESYMTFKAKFVQRNIVNL